MGDLMTKVILTVAHDYCMRLDGIQVYSLVGDDEVSLHNDNRVLLRHLSTLERVGFRVSREDTYVSRKLIFYCEEGSLIPQSAAESTHVDMRTGRELKYLDYPRIRLLLSVRSETDTYSMTNVGRFSLLGKETRWVYSVNKPALAAFQLAGVIQHILVPMDSDTLCPYTPLEIGGDGAFTPDPGFLRQVVDDHSRDARETKYRMQALMGGTLQSRFVRSDRLNEVVHKHHLLLPVLRELRQYLPEESVLIPEDRERRLLLASMRIRDLESPEQTWLRLCRGFYYGMIFRGEDPIEPRFEIDRHYSIGHTEVTVDFDEFIHRWANPGFRITQLPEYYVWRYDAEYNLDPLHVDIGLSTTPRANLMAYPASRDIFERWLETDVDLTVSSVPDLINFIRTRAPLPERVVKRLNLFMESDNYILSILPRENIPSSIGIITRDAALCAEVRSRLEARTTGSVYVFCIDPALYMMGIEFYPAVRAAAEYGIPDLPEDVPLLEDPGAMLHVDFTEFRHGCYLPTYDYELDYSLEPSVRVRRHRYHRMVIQVIPGPPVTGG